MTKRPPIQKLPNALGAFIPLDTNKRKWSHLKSDPSRRFVTLQSRSK